mgnify:CR=1 FL=1
MTDTERIVKIISDKKLSNVDFCATTTISPATLSHITSGRSKPTLTILRNIVTSFPDLNPEWVMLGTGAMYRDGLSPQEPLLENSDRDSSFDTASSVSTAASQVPPADDLSDFAQNLNFGSSPSSTPPVPAAPVVPRLAAPPPQPAYAGSNPISRHHPSAQPAGASMDVKDVVREVVSQLHLSRPAQRRITEIRIFFDDGTYESFGS